MSYQLAQDIRQVAEQNDMALGELCKIVGVSPSSLSNWSRGEYSAKRKKESRVRTKLNALSISSVPKTDGFISRKVSEVQDGFDRSNDDTVRMIAAIANAEYTSSVAKLGVIRDLLGQ